MNITLATHGFAHPGGSETYVLTVAEQLQRLGHGVIIFAGETGPMAEFAIDRGLEVTSELGALQGRCDAILVQDSILSYLLAEHYPHAPQLFRACSDLYDFQLPPCLPGVVDSVVVCSDRVGRRIAALATRPIIHRLRQPIDTERFMPAGSPSPTPQRAVLLGNYLRGERLAMIRGALENLGVACLHVGALGDSTHLPERAIWAADIVVAKGRAALEGMACGRAVFVYDQFGGDGWVTPQRYPSMEADNFAGLSGPLIATGEQLQHELARYSPGMGIVNRELAISHHGARAHTQELLALLQQRNAPGDLGDAPGDPGDASLRELSRLVRAQWLAERRALGFEQASRLAHEAAELARGELQRAHDREAQLGDRLERALTTGSRLNAELDLLRDELRRCQNLLGTRRARIGLRLGDLADDARRRVRSR